MKLDFSVEVLTFVVAQDLKIQVRQIWWARVDSNHRPHAYQACALTT